MQLKVHGQIGILGAPALVLVTLMQNGIEQETLLGVQYPVMVQQYSVVQKKFPPV